MSKEIRIRNNKICYITCLTLAMITGFVPLLFVSVINAMRLAQLMTTEEE